MDTSEKKEIQTDTISHLPAHDKVDATFDVAKEAIGGTAAELGRGYYRSASFIGTVAAFCLSVASEYLAWVLPANSLGLINEDIGPSPNITWVALAYTLALSVMFLLVGRLSDLFGRRWFFILGNLIGLLSAIIGATAQNVNQLIAGNTLAGIAAAVQISVTAAIGELVPNKDRLIWVMFILGVNPLPFAAFGPIIAHKFVTSTGAGWRWSFYLNIIATSLATILFFFFYHPPSFKMLHQNRTKWDQIRKLDYVGMVLFTGGLILFIMGLSWGGSAYPWKSARVIATIVVGAVTLAAFVMWEYFFKGDPLLPVHLLRIRGYISIVVTATVGSCVYYSMNIIWPQEIAALFTTDPTWAGWLACTVGGATLVGQISGALALRYIGHQRVIYIGASIGLTAFAGALASVNPGQVHQGVAFMFLSCVCVGVIELSALALAPLVCPPEEIGVATGTLGSIRSAGSTVATAIYTTILSNKLASFVPKYVEQVANNNHIPTSSVPLILGNLTAGSLGTAQPLIPGLNIEALTAVVAADAQANADAFRYVFYAVIAFGVLAICCACLTVNYSVQFTDDVARKLVGKRAAVETTNAEKASMA